MLRFDGIVFRYDPFPVGVATDVFDERDYAELVATYPDDGLFVADPGIGRRFTLSYQHNPRGYLAHFRRHAAWRTLRRYVSSLAFIRSALGMLRSHHIDLGVDRPTLASRAWLQYRGVRRGHPWPWRAPVATELVFARLPADGGSLLPHTDGPRKIVNMALPMSAPGAWDATAGGGTEIIRPKDLRNLFNRTNTHLDFGEVETLEAVPFRPNQALIVVRTDVSWHCIRPMQAAGSTAMRRTINISLVHPGY